MSAVDSDLTEDQALERQRELKRDYMRAWRRDHPGQIAMYGEKRRAKYKLKMLAKRNGPAKAIPPPG